MVQCIATFMDACYIARRNAITGPALKHFHSCVEKFHTLQNIFITAGVRSSMSLPHQHALIHYFCAIHLFGSPNGLCLSITESKHIKAVKEPWRRSSWHHVLIQMLRTLVQMDKMVVLHCLFSKKGMLAGTTSSHMMWMKAGDISDEAEVLVGHDGPEDDDEDDGAVLGSPSGVLSEVSLASKSGMLKLARLPVCCWLSLIQNLATLAIFKPWLNLLISQSFLLPYAGSSSCITTQIWRLLVTWNSYLRLKVTSRFITQLLQFTMHQALQSPIFGYLWGGPILWFRVP